MLPSLRQLRSLCQPIGSVKGPFLRYHAGELYTVATNGHAFLAVRKQLTQRTAGPSRFYAPMRWHRRHTYRWAQLKYFFATRRVPGNDVSAPVRVHGVLMNAILAHRYTLFLKAETVELSRERYSKLPALRIEGPNWFVVIMPLHKPRNPRAFRGRPVRRP